MLNQFLDLRPNDWEAIALILYLNGNDNKVKNELANYFGVSLSEIDDLARQVKQQNDIYYASEIVATILGG